jgi:hypothetical protein
VDRGQTPLNAARAEAVGEDAKALGGLLSDALGGEAGLERVGVGEQPAERFEVLRLVQVGERKLVDHLRGVGEVGVDLKAVEVADDQQRRVFQVLPD